MNDFKQQFGFVIFFIVLTLIVSMTFGSKVATWFLVLVLLGMLVTNSQKVVDLMAKFSTPVGSGGGTQSQKSQSY